MAPWLSSLGIVSACTFVSGLRMGNPVRILIIVNSSCRPCRRQEGVGNTLCVKRGVYPLSTRSAESFLSVWRRCGVQTRPAVARRSDHTDHTAKTSIRALNRSSTPLICPYFAGRSIRARSAHLSLMAAAASSHLPPWGKLIVDNKLAEQTASKHLPDQPMRPSLWRCRPGDFRNVPRFQRRCSRWLSFLIESPIRHPMPVCSAVVSKKRPGLRSVEYVFKTYQPVWQENTSISPRIRQIPTDLGHCN